jgi:hypothetical protein
MVSMKRAPTADESKYKIVCQRCKYEWGSPVPPDGMVGAGGAIDDRSQCRRCGCRILAATLNEPLYNNQEHVNAEREMLRMLEDRDEDIDIPDYDSL